MFKLLVVDDEEFVRNGIASLNVWNKLCFDRIRTAADGFEALNVMDEFKPDVVITDIRMPEMDGLKLAEKIKLLYPGIVIVILSAYDDFEYAKQAITNGVKGYLLKPLKEMELIEVFTRIKEELIVDKERTKASIDSETAKKEILLKKIIKGILENENEKNILNELLKAGVDLKDKFLRIAVCSFDLLYLTQSRQHEFQFIINSTKNFCDNNNFPVTLYMGYMVIIINSERAISKCETIRVIKKYISCIESDVEHQYSRQLSIAIGVGNLCKEISAIPLSYSQALYAISGQYPKENCSVVLFQDLNVFDISGSNEEYSVLESFDMESIVESIIDDIFNYNTNALTGDIHVLLKSIEQSDIYLLEDVKLKFMEIIFLIGQNLKDRGITNITFNKLKLLKTIESFSRFSDLKNWFRDELRRFAENINESKTSSFENSTCYIEKAKAYITKEYNKRITLSEIAKFLHLNPVYFSITFKKKTGQNFIDYVNSVKIIKAKELLQRPGHKVKEVALMVGYDDYSYFCKVFRKVTGTTPVEYRVGNRD